MCLSRPSDYSYACCSEPLDSIKFKPGGRSKATEVLILLQNLLSPAVWRITGFIPAMFLTSFLTFCPPYYFLSVKILKILSIAIKNWSNSGSTVCISQNITCRNKWCTLASRYSLPLQHFACSPLNLNLWWQTVHFNKTLERPEIFNGTPRLNQNREKCSHFSEKHKKLKCIILWYHRWKTDHKCMSVKDLHSNNHLCGFAFLFMFK